MSRPKSIPVSVDSLYFERVTPFWVAPAGLPIPETYKPAIQSLAEWVGPTWPEKDSGFFVLRTILVSCCEDCTDHDWRKDVVRADVKRSEQKQREALIVAAKKFKIAMRKAPFAYEKLELVRSIAWGLGANIESSVSNGHAIEVLWDAIDRFPKIVEGASSFPFNFGPLEYKRVPKSLPRKEVAVALYLADRVSMWRRDGLAAKKFLDPHKPQLTRNLPWKAIAQFASTTGTEESDFLNPVNVQTHVLSLSKRVERLVPPRKS